MRTNPWAPVATHEMECRLILHSDLLTRIQDDIRRMHWDLADRIQSLHDEVLKIPGVATTEGILGNNIHPNFLFEDSSPCIPIPRAAEDLFESAFVAANAPSVNPSLSNLSDVFLSSFYESTYRFQPGLDLHRQPPNDQYINLLKCIWLMRKMQSSEELGNAVPDSHWPSYIKELDKQLSRQCARFSGQTWERLELPHPLTTTENNTRIWPEKNVKDNTLVQVVKEESLEEIFRTQATRDSDNDMVGLSVLRRIQPDHESLRTADEFRICFTSGNGVAGVTGDLKPLDFSLKMAMLKPVYAVDPDPRFGRSLMIETGPTTMSRTSTRLDFRSAKEMLKFQHALTGYKVWANEIFHVSVKFIYKSGPKGNDIPSQDACLQLWSPRRQEQASDHLLSSGPSSPSDSGVHMSLGRRFSTLTLSKTKSWAPSLAETMQTANSIGSTRTMVVQMEGNTPGILHVKPDKPLLVLFTRHPHTGERLMVTIELNALNVNPKRCDCDRNDVRSQQCLNVAIERDAGKQGEPLLGVTRFETVDEGQKDWDVSRLAFERRGAADEGRKPWTDLTRLTIKFHDADDRRRFSGGRCACKNRGKKETWTELQHCVKQNHRGFLGEVKMHYGLQIWEYDEWRKHRQQVVHRIG